jgi:hypothetical protein
MLFFLKKIKRTRFWLACIDFFIYPIYYFVWSFFINFQAKLLFFFWRFKKRDYFSLDNNDKLLVGTNDEFKAIASKILNETKNLEEKYKNIILSKEYSEEMKKTNFASGEVPYSISLYKDLSPSLKNEIVKFASSEKMITTASQYMKIFPILTRVQVNLNIPRENSQLRGAMFWHKDGFGFKNLDFFMSVTDLDENNGPFYCLEKKVNAGIFKSFDLFFSKTGERNKVPLEVFDKKFPNEKITELKGSSGTGMFLDSFSTYHRGGYCSKKNRIMLRFCYQSHDAICDRFYSNEDFFPYDSSITKNNTKNIFKNYLYFKKPPFFLKILKSKILKFYYLIEHRYNIK